ncbi:MAG: NAD(P)H-dependent oxidoreductase [Pseudomonadota bacterium]
MSRRIFVWVAHPKPNSLCAALADAYQASAEAAGAQVRRMNLSEMTFDPLAPAYVKDLPELEPDLAAWQAGVAWADHLLVVHPLWWGAMPAQAKAVLDRALAPGFAYKYHARGVAWDKLLAGKTADAVITSDTPPIIDTLIYRRTARRVLCNQILGFCGVKARKVLQLGSVKLADARKIRGWLDRLAGLGARAAA